MTQFRRDLFEETPIVGILRHYSWDDTCFIVEAFRQAGLSTLEITLNTPDALQYIATLAEEYPDLNIGAGTVCTVSGLKSAVQAGVSFVVSPILDADLIQSAIDQQIVIFPGAYSPTEIYRAWQAGASAVKVFPATRLGPSFIKDIRGPFSDIKLIPTGGISRKNISEYRKAGAYGYGMGRALFDAKLLQERDSSGLIQHFKTLASLVSP